MRRISTRRRIADRAARWVVAAGGLVIIASILGILIFIAAQVWPLTRPARVRVEDPVPYRSAALLAALSDEYRNLVAGIAADGSVTVLHASDGSVVVSRSLVDAPARIVAAAAEPGDGRLSAATNDGRVLSIGVHWDVSFDSGSRVVEPRFDPPVTFELDPAGLPPRLHSVSLRADGAGFAAAVLADSSLAVARRETRENLLTGETAATVTVERARLEVEPTTLLVDQGQQTLYVGTAAGEILRWDLRHGIGGGGGEDEPEVVRAGTTPLTALALLIGGRSLVAGSADGTLGIFAPVRRAEADAPELTLIRELPALGGAVLRLAPSLRNRSFLAWSEDGDLGLYHSTSGRRLWSGRTPGSPVDALLFTPRGDGAFLAEAGSLYPVAISSPHPETTLRTLFGKVWYEGYDEPALVWQSSGGSDDFEPKLSLTPLIYGTLKGTFFSLLLAIPIGVLGATYVSQFMHPLYQRYVKPMVEVMAALPTVVLGFLAGLWLAPLLERVLPGLAAGAVLVPLAVIGAAWLWRQLPARIAGRLPLGSEIFLFVAVITGGLLASIALSAPIEAALFGGNFRAWLEQATGLGYEQRNAIVVGVAMGFAVIPIIFAISEDALSNVPRNLVAGSLALGATRWQTVIRVVLPTASPGIFSATMVGFGRAVGETMIVLMATGNTPIMSFSPFNGFRTLSASIAVEIPEAPVGGTLYRTLFVAALVLFALTFLVNTVAELVRQRLRERFARL